MDAVWIGFALYTLFTLLVLYHAVKVEVWEIGSIVYLFAAMFWLQMSWSALFISWLVIIGIDVLIRSDSLRMRITDWVIDHARNTLPKLSKTEEIALNTGDTWLEKYLFTGEMRLTQNLKISSLESLSEEEKSFLDNETEVLCSLVDEWKSKQQNDLSREVWDYLKEKGFFGIVIPKQYGGKEFSALAHSAIIIKIATRSMSTAITMMVPNSLGPGELLVHYGTEKQRAYYLPRLAAGIDIPCFALTEPNAGSDATSIQSEAIVVQKKIDGKIVLGLLIKNLNKRWITLAPVATLIGLAVKVKDPDGLLKGNGEEGITCVLVSRDTENLEIGARHLPAGLPFMNGSIRGDNIFVPITNVIGGQEQVGSGWKMLIECLSVGRSVSLPAVSMAGSCLSYLTTGAYARVRRQFNTEIAKFEGIEEKLAEIAGLTYLIHATNFQTLAAVDEHKKPSVASAISKYITTELSRKIITHAMDVHAGRTVVLGPKNYLSNLFNATPIMITVEGANIMTRNLLIFGQGSIACHPFVREEFKALSENNSVSFHKLLWKHINYFLRNFAKSVCTAWTGGYFVIPIRSVRSELRREYQKITRLTYAYAWLADLLLISIGGALKRKERLSARLADALTYLYMSTAVLRFYKPGEENHAKWAIAYSCYNAQKAMIDCCKNLPSKLFGRIARLILFPLGQTMSYPSDILDHKLAQEMSQNNTYRERMKSQVYLSKDIENPVDKLENALQEILNQESLLKRMHKLWRIPRQELKETLEQYVTNKEMSQNESEAFMRIQNLCWGAIQVDEFNTKNHDIKDDIKEEVGV